MHSLSLLLYCHETLLQLFSAFFDLSYSRQTRKYLIFSIPQNVLLSITKSVSPKDLNKKPFDCVFEMCFLKNKPLLFFSPSCTNLLVSFRRNRSKIPIKSPTVRSFSQSFSTLSFSIPIFLRKVQPEGQL